MGSVNKNVPVFQCVVGIAASAAIVYLLADSRPGLLEARTIAILAVAILALAGGLAAPWAARRGRWPRLSARGRLDLASYALSSREQEFVREFLGGKSMKAISIDHGLSHSTVRNVFSSAYQKLGVSGNAELAALGASYLVE